MKNAKDKYITWRIKILSTLSPFISFFDTESVFLINETWLRTPIEVFVSFPVYFLFGAVIKMNSIIEKRHRTKCVGICTSTLNPVLKGIFHEIKSQSLGDNFELFCLPNVNSISFVFTKSPPIWFDFIILINFQSTPRQQPIWIESWYWFKGTGIM